MLNFVAYNNYYIIIYIDVTILTPHAIAICHFLQVSENMLLLVILIHVPVMGND